MNKNYRKIKRLFLRQSYLDTWEDYQRSLRKSSYITWDYVILTASNEEQAQAYREQIEYRLSCALLPSRTHYAVLSDPDGKRVGSGGATFNVLKYIAQQDQMAQGNPFKGKRILVIHSGGDSKRVPQYSACGKLFSPVPRELPDGRASTLFDEFVIAMTGVAGRIADGMLVLSGDVLLLFNPLQIDAQFRGAAAISIKESVEIGKNHGVFLNDGTDHVERFLHKQTEENLRALGAVNAQNAVDLDTGAVMMDTALLYALFGLISTDNRVDDEKFAQFVNERARISFYGDFLYPLAKKSTLEDYYKEAAEGSLCEELMECRTKIWEALHTFQMKLLCLSPAEFIHFGTTRELLEMVTDGVDDYEFLGWKRRVITNAAGEDGANFGKAAVSCAVSNSLVSAQASVGAGAYIEDSIIRTGVRIGERSIVSNLELSDCEVPDHVVLHALRLQGGRHVTRMYGVHDNPKGTYEEDAPFLETTLRRFCVLNGIEVEELWDAADVGQDELHYLWFANLYPVCKTQEESLRCALVLADMAAGTATEKEVADWKAQERTSLCASFNAADVRAIVPWKQELANRIMVEKFVGMLEKGMYCGEALAAFGDAGINEEQYRMLMQRAQESSFSTRIRILYDLSRYMKKAHRDFDGQHYDALENKCFAEIQKVIYENGRSKIPSFEHYKIVKDEVSVALPVRVNWGGGWTDTPPHCNEKGGVVLNAAIKLNGVYPVQVTVRRLKSFHVEFESTDIQASGIAETAAEIQDCHNPYDFFALHKAALIACGIVPAQGECDLQSVLRQLGGGLYLSTQVIGVPKGSGLGTSSILSGACVKALFSCIGQELDDDALFDIVLCMEQIMSTGGGWQDQVGGIAPGIKMITTQPGIDQKLSVEKVQLRPEVQRELQERFALIYTGQRRLARNLLRDVVGNYIAGRRESIEALEQMPRIAALMKFELERGDVDAFAGLLNEHWELSKQLDSGSTNTCIDQIFLACEDLIDGRFISGAGGGGFLQVILKKGVTRERLGERLREVFQDSGVTVWDTEFV